MCVTHVIARTSQPSHVIGNDEDPLTIFVLGEMSIPLGINSMHAYDMVKKSGKNMKNSKNEGGMPA